MRIRALLVVAVLGGCAADDDLDVSGTWQGASESDQQFSLALVQDGLAITGSAVITPGNLTGQPFSATVTGALTNEPAIAITIDTGNGSVAFRGTIVSEDRMSGQLDGSGWVHSAIDFTR